MKKYTYLLIAAVVAVTVFLANRAEPAFQNTDGTVSVHFIDVGQADSILVCANGETMLIDAGTIKMSYRVVDYLNKRRIKRIDHLVATHPHEDHIGGMADVIDQFEIGALYMPKETANTKTFENMVKSAKAKGLQAKVPKTGDRIPLKNTECTVLAPTNGFYESVNNYSIVLRLVYGNTSFLFTGDAEELSESEILRSGFEVQADVLKIGHHGSQTSTSEAFLKAVSPKYAIISVGAGNSYGHPNENVIERLEKNGVTIYRTDFDKDIVVYSDGKQYFEEKRK